MNEAAIASDQAAARQLYLDLMQNCLLGMIYQDPPQDSETFDPARRLNGRDWPTRAHSMIGKLRMDNLRTAVEYVIDNAIPGDFIETGVSPGGVVIVDDYGILPACRNAVHDFRDRNGIDDAIRVIDTTGVWWIKTQ